MIDTGNNCKNRITWIDSLKGIAICGVLLVHTGTGNFSTQFDKIINSGQYCVQIFFIISVYLCFISYEKFLKRSSALPSPKKYLWTISRFIKLAPLFYLATLIYGLINHGSSYWLGESGHITIGNVLSHLTFTHGLFPHYSNSIIGVEWYIGTLSVFYVLIPLLYRFINSFEKSVVFFLISSIFSFLISFYIDTFCHFNTDFHIYYAFFYRFSFIAQLPVMALGIVLFYILKSNAFSQLECKKPLSYALFVLSVITLYGIIKGNTTVFGITTSTLYSLIFLIIIISASLSENRIIDNPVFAVLGKYSYTIYLSHMLLLQIYTEHFYIDTGNAVLTWLIKYFIVLGSSLIISIPIENLLNKPLCSKLMHIINK